MKPACRPISLTRPTPPTAEWASTIAALIDFAASVKEVTKPKLWPMNGMSLSMVFGMPITPIVSPRRSRASEILAAPRIEPSPPITNSRSIPSAISRSTMASGSCAPREVPSIVPPCRLMPCTTAGVSRTGSGPPSTSPA